MSRSREGRAKARKQARRTDDVTAWYHGGVGGLAPGERVRPPTETGNARTADAADFGELQAELSVRRDRVYLTTDPMLAACFAALRYGTGGQVYEVRPVGGLVPDRADPRSAHVGSAYVLRVESDIPVWLAEAGEGYVELTQRECARRGWADTPENRGKVAISMLGA